MTTQKLDWRRKHTWSSELPDTPQISEGKFIVTFNAQKVSPILWLLLKVKGEVICWSNSGIIVRNRMRKKSRSPWLRLLKPAHCARRPFRHHSWFSAKSSEMTTSEFYRKRQQPGVRNTEQKWLGLWRVQKHLSSSELLLSFQLTPVFSIRKRHPPGKTGSDHKIKTQSSILPDFLQPRRAQTEAS